MPILHIPNPVDPNWFDFACDWLTLSSLVFSKDYLINIILSLYMKLGTDFAEIPAINLQKSIQSIKML